MVQALRLGAGGCREWVLKGTWDGPEERPMLSSFLASISVLQELMGCVVGSDQKEALPARSF